MNLKKQRNRLTSCFGKEGKAMKRIGLLIGVVCILVMFAGTGFAGGVYVRGHYRSNGTYVQPHYRSAPDRSFRNNWSTYPNVNPYTGKIGTRRGYGSYSRSYRGYSFGGYGTRSGRFR